MNAFFPSFYTLICYTWLCNQGYIKLNHKGERDGYSCQQCFPFKPTVLVVDGKVVFAWHDKFK